MGNGARNGKIYHILEGQKNILIWEQGRSDGVSRVSNAYGPTSKGGPPKRKFTLDICI